MNWPDAVNGGFEILGAPFVLLSLIKLLRERDASGVSLVTLLFFSSWGFWNLFFYSHLGQWWSVCGSVTSTLANTAWAIAVFYYRGKR
jgi:hypothetical protein